MKGQAQAVTAVLITSVIIGAIATSYTWGVPLLEKQQSQAQLERTQQNVLNLYNRIEDTSQSGEGTTARVEVTEGLSADNFRLNVNQEDNYIDIRTNGRNPPYPTDVWTLVKGQTLQNLSVGSGAYATASVDLPGAVLVRPVEAPGETLVTYRVEFRNQLFETPSGPELRRINISVEDQTRSSGETTVFISNEGTNWERGNEAMTLPSGEQVPRKNTEITIGFR